MKDLRACVVPSVMIAGLIVIAPVYADNSLPSFSSSQNAIGAGATGRVTSASSQYLFIDQAVDNATGRVWDIQNQQFVNLASQPEDHVYALAVSGNVVVGTLNSEAYQWTLNGSNATGQALVSTTPSQIYGVSGAKALGATVQNYVIEYPGVGSFPISPQNATYWDSTGAHVIPTGDDRYANSGAVSMSGNKAAGWTQGGTLGDIHNATVWTINTSNQTSTQQILCTDYHSEANAISGNLVGGFMEKPFGDTGFDQHRAAAWKLNSSAANDFTTIDLHPDDTAEHLYDSSDVLAVESQVQIGQLIYDIAVGYVTIDSITTAALWLIGDGFGDAEHPYELITLANGDPSVIGNTTATSIVVEDGKLAAIYGFGERVGYDGYIPLVWTPDGIGAEVPEPMAAAILLVGACGMMLRRPRHA